ncbi:hypothetical protein B566_EDAN015581 [Ephemera danica]|nr:hypothetical protein B566_EDAN015581 [Ephemera danica]
MNQQQAGAMLPGARALARLVTLNSACAPVTHGDLNTVREPRDTNVHLKASSPWRRVAGWATRSGSTPACGEWPESLDLYLMYPVAHCIVQWNSGSLDSWNGTSILLPRFVVMPDLVLTWVQDIRREFKFKPKLYESAQNILRNFGQSYGNDTQNLTYIGVHVRRTDYKGYLWRTRKMNLADAAYFHRAMDYFREKYKHVAFVIVSDESAWCIEHLSANDVTVIRSRTTSPGLDLALMANCNHSIIDYGTFGVWGAILAGGETVLYNISRHSSVRVAQLLPRWHVMD